MKKILQTYLRRLTNLSANNRSLLLLRLYVDQFIDIHEFDYMIKEPSFKIIYKLIAGKSKIKLCSQLDPRDKSSNELSNRLKKIQRIDNFLFEERGSKDLYVGWPIVKGKFMDGTIIRGPLLFFPVELELKDNLWLLNLRKDVSLTFNKSFLLAYSYYNEIKLGESLIERVFDDFDREGKNFKTSLYQLLRESPIELNFNPELFNDELSPFSNMKKSDMDDSEKKGILKLYPEAVLGIFPQSGSYLVPDYTHLLENKEYPNIEDFFNERSFSEPAEREIKHLSFFYFLNKIKEEQTFTPFKMDAFQENALKAVKKGNSIVVQGPPGTGKSQLICNLISDFIARGKRVLVVCQKRAALDVVYKRLLDEEISDFVALVHDFKNDRKNIFSQIKSQIDNLYEYKLKNNSLDSIQLERKFLQASRTIDNISEELDELKHAIFDENECGVSIKELYLTSSLKKPSISLKQEYNYFKFDELNYFIEKLKYYLLYAKKFLKEGYPWRVRKNYKDYSITDLKNILDLIDSIPAFQEELVASTKKIVKSEVNFLEAEAIILKKEGIENMFELLRKDKVYELFGHIMSTSPKDADNLFIRNVEKNIMLCFEGAGIEKSLPVSVLGKFQEALQKMFESRRNVFKWIRWILFSKDRPMIRKALINNQLSVRRRDLKLLTQRLDNRLNYEHNLTKLRDNAWLKDIPERPEKETLQEWFDQYKDAIAAKDIFVSVRGFSDFFNVSYLKLEDFDNQVSELLSVLGSVQGKRLEWEIYLTPTKIQEILGHKYQIDRLKDVLNKDFESLCDFDRLKDELLEFEKSVINKVEELIDKYSEQELIDIFTNSLKLSWIDHIETKYPILRTVSSLKFEPLIKSLQDAVKEKLKVSKEIVLMKSRERTYSEVMYNRLNNMTTYRDLSHQVGKKRKIWPIRRLVSHFSRELFNLIPCWMTSPEAASAIFPMEKLFDVVIFDEASQCFVERGLPAMYRGHQVVVAGDSQQLSPFDLYKTRWDDDSQDIPELEIDSLLDLSEKYLMQAQLRGHYRSKSIDLIDFSNKHFYDYGLSLLPDRKIINRNEPAIEFKKVDGVWANNCNSVEADYVIALVYKIIAEAPKKEIGIITFNARQQDLIYDKLEEYSIEHGVPIPRGLIIKNIENVQGDEKDIIIFSLTHGPDENGKFSMQFGSLNIPRGENRLNVAVTRAREKIYLVTSFFPQEMNVENLKNDGPKLLKEYLIYAMEVSEGKFIPALRPSAKSSNNWYLKRKLKEDLIAEKKFTMEISESLPFSDLTLKKDDQYLGLILTDDDLYYQSVSAKETHVYNPFTLSSKNWKFRGVFSREVWQDNDEVIERMIRYSNHLE